MRQVQATHHAPLSSFYEPPTFALWDAGRKGSLPAITNEQRLKLRQLTIISIAEDKKVRMIWYRASRCVCSPHVAPGAQ